MNASTIDEYERNMLITPTEAERLKEWDKNLTEPQKSFIKKQKNKLLEDIAKLPFRDGNLESDARIVAQNEFEKTLEGLDPLDKNFREEVMKARQNALVKAVEDSGKKIQSGWLWQSETKFGSAYKQRQEMIRAETEEMKRESYSPPEF